MTPYTVRKSCRACGGDDLHPFANLGSTPLADVFPSNKNAEEVRYPLSVKVCGTCFLVQQMADVDDSILYGADYGFSTGSSPSSLKYFEDYAAQVMKAYPVQVRGLTIEIASNDGTFLKHFQDAGCGVLGIDPAEAVAEAANNRGIETLPLPFNTRSAITIEARCGQVDLIVANNVVAHVTDLHDFLAGVKYLLHDDGVFIFEVQYFPDLLTNLCFDNIYHEHRSFFSVTPLVPLLASEGLKITHVLATSAQGGSIRVTARHLAHAETIGNDVGTYLIAEKINGVREARTYSGFQDRVDSLRTELREVLRLIKAKGRTIAGYGASAKSSTLLNYCGIDGTILDYVLDTTPHKIGRFTPGTHIPIVGPQDENGRPDYYLLLVWNYLDDVLERERGYRNRGGKFIVPIPRLRIV